MGWYGFNGGSQLALGSFEDSTAMGKIFVNTHLAGCGGCAAGAIITRLVGGKTDIIMMLNGALAGLVSITAGPLDPSPIAAILIGAVGGLIMYLGTHLLNRLKLDDVVGAIPVHMFAGIWGTLIVPFSSPDTSYVTQFIGVVSVISFVFVLSFIVFLIIKHTIGLRISEEAEQLGTDKAEVGVLAYSIRD
jgi:Amt family ammonium transporter